MVHPVLRAACVLLAVSVCPGRSLAELSLMSWVGVSDEIDHAVAGMQQAIDSARRAGHEFLDRGEDISRERLAEVDAIVDGALAETGSQTQAAEAFFLQVLQRATHEIGIIEDDLVAELQKLI